MFPIGEDIQFLTWLGRIVDILLVTYVIYKMIMVIRGTRAVQLVKGITVILAVWFLSSFFGLRTLQWIMSQMVTYGLLAIIIIFQPELRRALEQLGRGRIFGGRTAPEEESSYKTVEAIIKSVNYMAKRRIGALLSIEKETGMNDYVETGIPMNASITSELLINVFIPNTPLHDGAVIIRNNEISAAACYLPLSENPFISKELGTRHRAALGISEVTDSLTIAVSEETGSISVTKNGDLHRDIDEETLRAMLEKDLVIDQKQNGSISGSGEGKRMDKLFNNHWFIKFISLMIAVMLYTMVNMENVNNQPGALPTVNETTHMIEDVEIEAYYDDEQYAIVEIAETVDITLTGPQSSITMFLVNPNYEVYVDLEDRGEGIHHVNIQHSGFPAELAVSIVPQNIQVELQERETVSLPVEVELQNTEGVEDGYTLGAPQVSPSEVEVTAPRAVLNQISSVRTFIDVAGTNERVETTGTVAVYDEFGNELNVEVNPETVDVEIPVTSPFVSVPVNLTREGSLEEGLTIVDLELEPTEVTIFGPQEVIDDIQVVEGVVLDLSAITESQTLELEVEPPPGVEEVRPNTVTVTIEVADEEEATIEDVPIEIEEGEDGDTIEITDPEEETTDVDVYGSESELEAIEEEDIRIIGEVEEGEDGEQTVPLEGEGPEEITVEPEVEEAEVEISEEEEQDNNDEEENGNDNDDETEE